MPSRSEKQRRFFAADLAAAQKGEPTKTGLPIETLEEFAKKPLLKDSLHMRKSVYRYKRSHG